MEIFVVLGLLLVLLEEFAKMLLVGAVLMLFPWELMDCATSSVTGLGSSLALGAAGMMGEGAGTGAVEG